MNKLNDYISPTLSVFNVNALNVMCSSLVNVPATETEYIEPLTDFDTLW